MTPSVLVEALCERHQELEEVELVHVHTEGKALYAEPPYSDSFMINSFFVGGNVRKSVNTRQARLIFLSFSSEIHLSSLSATSCLWTTLLSRSPRQTKHGLLLLGTSAGM
ncbi:MAG: hypothetical protein U5L96_14685 [Owenweeksia sp.]|nr:hypothetical protein [Owenweeksia sp.]